MANQIFKDQTEVRLILQTNVDFNSYTVSTALIKYEKPDGTLGEFTAAVLAGSEAVGKIYIDFDATHKFDIAGTWTLWAYITFSGSKIGIGRAIEYYVKTQGEKR